jgi:ABC-type antimicrobial peptide transport system permease subunit
MSLLKELAREKLVFVITHSPELAEEFADTIVTMEDGQIRDIQGRESDVAASALVSPGPTQTPSRMSFLSSFRYASRGLWLKKGRTIATALGTSIGIIGIALAFALTSGASSTFGTQITEIFPVNNITVTQDTQEGVPGLGDASLLSYQDLQAILAVSDEFSGYHANPTQMVMTREVSLSQAEAETDEIDENSLRMLDTSRPSEAIEEALYLGRLPEAGKTYEAVLSLNTANSLLGEDEELNSLLGQPLYVRYMVGQMGLRGSGNQQPGYFTVEYEIVGITSTNSLSNTMFLVSGANLGLLEQALDLPLEDLTFSSLTVYAGPTVTDISGFIAALNDQQREYIFVSTLESTISGVNAVLGAIRNVLIGLSSISVLVALLMISIVIYISVLEKTQEIGIIRAIGGRMQDIRNIFIAESITVGLLSGTIGIGIAYLLSHLINLLAGSMIGGGASRMMPSALRLARLSSWAALGLVGFCVGLSIVSGYIPARKAAGMDPVQALRGALYPRLVPVANRWTACSSAAARRH